MTDNLPRVANTHPLQTTANLSQVIDRQPLSRFKLQSTQTHLPDNRHLASYNWQTTTIPLQVTDGVHPLPADNRYPASCSWEKTTILPPVA